jgi:hypothetical protein
VTRSEANEAHRVLMASTRRHFRELDLQFGRPPRRHRYNRIANGRRVKTQIYRKWLSSSQRAAWLVASKSLRDYLRASHRAIEAGVDGEETVICAD